MNDQQTKLTANLTNPWRCDDTETGREVLWKCVLGTRGGFCSLVSISGGQREVPGEWGRGEMTGRHALPQINMAGARI